jgi:hypothetical protein
MNPDAQNGKSLDGHWFRISVAILVIVFGFMLGALGILAFGDWYYDELPELLQMDREAPPIDVAVGSLKYYCIAIPGFYEVHRWLPVAGLVISVGFITSSFGLPFNHRWAWWVSLLSFSGSFIESVIDMVFEFKGWSLIYDPRMPLQGIGGHPSNICCGFWTFLIYLGAIAGLILKWPTGPSIFDSLFRSHTGFTSAENRHSFVIRH